MDVEADQEELSGREPTDTFIIQAEIYIEDRDEDVEQMRQINHSAHLPPTTEDEDVVDSAESELESEPEKHEIHLAAIYEEVAELRVQVRLSLAHDSSQLMR